MAAYFDANATTPADPIALNAWQEAEREYWHNPSSPHRMAARAHHMLADARNRLARILDCPPDTLVFTAGATEANNAVMRYFAAKSGADAAVSAIEHPSVLEPARAFFGQCCHTLGASASGVVSAAELERINAAKPLALVSVMAANNETGVLQPWVDISETCRGLGIPLHIDASQWLGKKPAAGLGSADLVTGCAHKFGGPKGVGFLKISAAVNDLHIQLGGAQEGGRRGGTENYPAIAAMMAVLEKREACLGGKEKDWALARRDFEETLGTMIPGMRIIGQKVPRLANTSSLLMPRFPNTRWVARLDKKGFAVSTGSACATGKEGPSHVLAAMGIPADQARRMVRVSADWSTPAAAWPALAHAFAATWHELSAEEQPSASRVITL